MSDKDTIERLALALGALVAYFSDRRSEKWNADQARPDQVVRNAPACDFYLTEAQSGQRAALEITQFEWPRTRTTVAHAMRALTSDLEQRLAAVLSGAFTISVHMNSASQAFTIRNRKAAKATLEQWFRTAAPYISLGSLARVEGFPGIVVTRQSTTGPLSIQIPTSSTNIAYPDWIHDLNPVLAENARKFEGLNDMRRWLLIVDPGMVGRLSITGQVLEVPDAVDELFFIDLWPPKAKDVFSYNDVRRPDDGTTFDLRTGTVKVPVRFLAE